MKKTLIIAIISPLVFLWIFRFYINVSILYEDRLFHREEEYSTSKDYIMTYCNKKEHTQHKNIVEGCHDHSHVINKSPVKNAINDVLNEIGWWGPFGEIIQEMLFLIGFSKMVFILCCISAVIGVWIAILIIQRDIRQSRENDALPLINAIPLSSTMSYSNKKHVNNDPSMINNIIQSSKNYIFIIYDYLSSLFFRDKNKKKKE